MHSFEERSEPCQKYPFVVELNDVEKVLTNVSTSSPEAYLLKFSVDNLLDILARHAFYAMTSDLGFVSLPKRAADDSHRHTHRLETLLAGTWC